MTPVQVVYDAFLAKILEDEWEYWDEAEIQKDWLSILEGALPHFKFPRVSLDIEGDFFVSDLNTEEIQILASYMKCEWLNRAIMTWEHIKPLYEERDFSEANLISKLNELLTAERARAKNLESIYYRSIESKPFDYKQLAGNYYGNY